MWGFEIVVILLISCILPGFLKIRQFSISNEGIRINKPFQLGFNIKWNDFNKIEKREEKIMAGRVRRIFLAVRFLSNEETSEIKIEPCRDFRKESIEKITKILIKFADKFNKPYLEEL